MGYDIGVPGMCEGEIRTLTVPPRFAYGDEGVPPKIPGGATLHFTVELVKVIKTGESRDPNSNIPLHVKGRIEL